jgi:hypothetical protein
MLKLNIHRNLASQSKHPSQSIQVKASTIKGFTIQRIHYQRIHYQRIHYQRIHYQRIHYEGSAFMRRINRASQNSGQ